jgi:hypothetical protein
MHAINEAYKSRHEWNRVQQCFGMHFNRLLYSWELICHGLTFSNSIPYLDSPYAILISFFIYPNSSISLLLFVVWLLSVLIFQEYFVVWQEANLTLINLYPFYIFFGVFLWAMAFLSIKNIFFFTEILNFPTVNQFNPSFFSLGNTVQNLLHFQIHLLFRQLMDSWLNYTETNASYSISLQKSLSEAKWEYLNAAKTQNDLKRLSYRYHSLKSIAVKPY